MRLFNAMAAAVCTAIMGLTAGPALAANDPLPVEDFAIRPVMQSVTMSPSGDHIAYRVAQSRLGDYYVEVRSTDDLTGDPVRIGSSEMDIQAVSWLNDEWLRIVFRDQVTDRVDDQNRGAFRFRTAMVRADGRGRFQDVDFTVINPLPNDPDRVIVRQGGDIKYLTIDNRRTETILRGNDRIQVQLVDDEGNPRIANEFVPGDRSSRFLTRNPGEEVWREIITVDAEDETTRIDLVGRDSMNPNGLFVAAYRGHDEMGIYEFNYSTGEWGAEVFRVPGQDINVGRTHRDFDRQDTVAFRYYDEAGQEQWAYIDPEEQQFYEQLRATFPGQNVYPGKWSRDGSTMLIRTASPTNPNSYYLLKDGQLTLIGRERPHLAPENLSRVEYIEYEARDGRIIPAYVTVPEGEGPFPTIVVPHGGPWVEWRMTRFDEWGQMLANQGYLVIEPMFRGTRGLGIDHWESSFGQWGLAMSDDMDDGAQFLVEQGWADPDRLAMFGWSFGGYSGFAAVSRDPQIYQCVVAGAGVTDPVEFRAWFTRFRFGRDQLERGYAGVNTLDRVDQANVPILVIHGDIDERVRIYHSENMVAALSRANKPHRFVVLEDADHFDDRLTYDHRVTMYTEMMDFFENDCGPGGL